MAADPDPFGVCALGYADRGNTLMIEEPTRPRVVTIGGGHGQAVVLQALRYLECSISAVVATADDGGCSGELRREFGMPAPGDLRRCLSALALDQDLANYSEERICDGTPIPRCRGNLVIAERYIRSRSLQLAVDWVAARLESVGRVMPASEEPGTIVVCDRCHGLVAGEYNVASKVCSPLVVTVTGAYLPNLAAIDAIEKADAIIMGPGSFCTSTLSALQTGEVGAAVCRSLARRLFILNLTRSEGPCAGFAESDYISALASHLTISSLGETPVFAALRHAPVTHKEEMVDGTIMFSADIAAGDGVRHSCRRMASALGSILGIPARRTPETSITSSSAARKGELEEALANAGRFLQISRVQCRGTSG